MPELDPVIKVLNDILCLLIAWLRTFTDNSQCVVKENRLDPFCVCAEFVDALFLYIKQIETFHVVVSVIAGFLCRHQSVARSLRAFKTEIKMLGLGAFKNTALFAAEGR